jgi:glutathione peroxidase
MTLLDAPIARLDGTPSTLGEITGGQPALLVNVASKCGLTSQYTGLEALHEKYADRGFSVVGLPCNQFGGQEPGSAEEIETFCSTSYGVTFPLTEKIEVNGPGRHAIYDKLTPVATASGKSGDVQWNFEKFLVDGSGEVVARFSPQVPPEDQRIIDALEDLLAL